MGNHNMQQEKRYGDWISVKSGGKFWPLDPRIEEIHLEDIAHSLAMQCRFNGHLDCFYSVAQHSVYVSAMAQLPVARKYGLMHDGGEAYLCDLPRPLKWSFKQTATLFKVPNVYADAEERLHVAINARFDIPYDEEIFTEVKRCDNEIVFMEAVSMSEAKMNTHLWNAAQVGADMAFIPHLKTIDPDFFPWSPEIAKARFIARFNELFGT